MHLADSHIVCWHQTCPLYLLVLCGQTPFQRVWDMAIEQFVVVVHTVEYVPIAAECVFSHILPEISVWMESNLECKKLTEWKESWVVSWTVEIEIVKCSEVASLTLSLAFMTGLRMTSWLSDKQLYGHPREPAVIHMNWYCISSSDCLLPRPPSSFCHLQYEKPVEDLSHHWMCRASLAFAIPAKVQVAHVQFKTPIYLLLTSLVKQKYQPLRVSFDTACNQQLEVGVTNK